MRSSLCVFLLLTCSLSVEANKRDKGQTDECGSVIVYGRCVANQKDCGEGLREARCDDITEKIPCKIPCNWKKDIGDCKYQFSQWSLCDSSSNSKTRSGTLKRSLFNADCQSTVKVSKPCSPKSNNKRDCQSTVKVSKPCSPKSNKRGDKKSN